MRRIYTYLRALFVLYWPLAYQREGKIFVKYFISGTIGVIVHLSIFLVLLRMLGDELYLVATSVGLGIAVIVSFALQKYWTFRDNSLSRFHWQFVFFMVIALLNLLVNGFLMYILVTIFNRITTAQIVTILVLSLASYVLNRFITFRYCENIDRDGTVST